jgi:hypothetical protein
MADWIPGTNLGKLDAFQTFSGGLAQRPEAYGVSADDAAEAVRIVVELRDAANVANNPLTRTPITMAAMREKLSAAEKHLRRLATFIRHNPNVAAADLMGIGLVPKGEKRRILPPTTAPMLAIRGIIPGGHTVEFVDSATPDRRGKPDVAYRLELYVAYSPNYGSGADGVGMDTIVKTGTLHAVLTRNPAKVIHPNDRVGSMANYAGRWINRRGEAGPFSQPVRMVLAMPGESSLSEAA